MFHKKLQFIGIYIVCMIFFLLLLFLPMFKLISLAFTDIHGGFGLENFISVLKNHELVKAFEHSIQLSIGAGVIATVIGFIFSFTINFTRLPMRFKKIFENMVMFPMFLPTLAYGYTIIYAFGAQSPLTKLNHGVNVLNPFGPQGILLGFVIYTFPISFVLLNNSMKYVDMRLFNVSKLMEDSIIKRFVSCIIRPMLVTLVLSVIQCFFLAFTDFGLPSALGGAYPLVSTLLFTEMQGALANFGQGTVVAILMLLPTILTTVLILILQRYQVKNQVKSTFVAFGSKVMDGVAISLSTIILLACMLVFVPIFIVPAVSAYPYMMKLTVVHFNQVFSNVTLISTYRLTLMVSALTAIFGVILYFTMAYMATRSPIADKISGSLQFLSNLTNAIPGMVLGIALMMTFSGTPISGTVAILLIANLLHFFATPFQMATQALGKLSKHYETTGSLLGDHFFKTLVRIILPNMRYTIFEMMSYLFIQAMVTISAIVFLVSINTQTITTSMQSLQEFNQYAQVFVLAILLFGTNLIMKIFFHFLGTVEFSGKRKKVKISPTIVDL